MNAPRRVAAREADVGGLLIRRALPVAGKRLVGAWCFLDHLGPADIGDGPGMRVGPHPHTGLQTFTWMIDGEILHRDSLGYVQPIRPGQVNLMIAGRGISHSEESPQPHPPRLQAAQLWIALPEHMRQCAPAFEHYPDIPVLAHGGYAVSVLVGEFLGTVSPVRVHTPLLGVDLHATADAAATLPLRPDFEYAALVLEGEVTVSGETLAPGTLLDLGTGNDTLAVASRGRARVLLIGGEPLAEEVLLFWNFVARNAQEVAEYTRLWNAGDARFGEVQGFAGPRLAAPEPPAGLKVPR